MSYGYEVVPARVAFSVDRKFIFSDDLEKARARRGKTFSVVQPSQIAQLESQHSQVFPSISALQTEKAENKPLTEVPSATNDSSILARRNSNNVDFMSVDSQDNNRISLYANVIGKCHYLEAAIAQLKLTPIHLESVKLLRTEVEGLIEPHKSQVVFNEQPRQLFPVSPEKPIAEKREQKSVSKAKGKFIKSGPKTEVGQVAKEEIDNWTNLVEFKLCDAAKSDYKYVDDKGKDITHIYSYNKVMSQSDMEGISDILNKSDWRVLAWYFGPEATAKFGLENFEILERMPMHSTGKENFTVFVYIKTRKAGAPKPTKEHSNKVTDKQVQSPVLKRHRSQVSELPTPTLSKSRSSRVEQPSPQMERRASSRTAGKNDRK